MRCPEIFGFLILIPPLYACSCGTLTSQCDRGWSAGETIFLGTVAGIEKGANPFIDSAHFMVAESFRGAAVGGAEAVIHSDGSNCNYPFAAGASYLVYATKDPKDGLLYTSRCTETRPAVMVGGALRELRARRDSIFGTIGTAAGGGDLEFWTASQPLPKVPVRATGGKGKSYSTQTDDQGSYAFASLPAGTYKIEVDLPKGYSPAPPLTAEVSGGDACRVDHFAGPDGRIEGTVLDAAGNPMPGFVAIQPADPAGQRGGLPGYDAGPDGKFSLPHVPPGRYRLVFHPKTGRAVNFRVTFYWPPSVADAIDLASGQHIDALEFKTPTQ